MAIIKTRVPNFNGYRGNVLFVNGVGETNDEAMIEWFKSNGYDVEESNRKVVESRKEPIKSESELEQMDVDDLKTYAKSVGKSKGVGVLKTKEQVIKHLTKE